MRKILYIIGFCICTIGASAQSNTSVTYSMGFATGDLGEYISQASFRGLSIDYRKLINPKVGVGVTFGWNVFYDELSSDTYTIDNVSLTGKQWRYSNNFPMLVAGTYYLKPGEMLNPFAGLGVGTIYTKRNTDMSQYTLKQEAWNFAMQPEIGVLIEMNDNTSFSISGKYSHGFQAGNELDNSQSFFSLNVGFSFY